MDTGGPNELDKGPDPHVRDTFEKDDIGISPHAIDQCSDWPAAEAIEYHIKFFCNEKSPLRCGLSSKFFDHWF